MLNKPKKLGLGCALPSVFCVSSVISAFLLPHAHRASPGEEEQNGGRSECCWALIFVHCHPTLCFQMSKSVFLCCTVIRTSGYYHHLGQSCEFQGRTIENIQR